MRARQRGVCIIPALATALSVACHRAPANNATQNIVATVSNSASNTASHSVSNTATNTVSNKISNSAAVPASETVNATKQDTVRGIIALVGTAAQPTVAITLANGRTMVVRGAVETVLRNVNNFEVTLFGHTGEMVTDGALPREAALFRATAFLVRAVQGVPASDGILLRVESGFALQHANGSLSALPIVPEALHAHVGARIFWVGAYDVTPSAYGVITPRSP